MMEKPKQKTEDNLKEITWAEILSYNVGRSDMENYYKQEHKRLKEINAELLEALKSLVDDDKCSFDYHGYCQTHFSGSSPCLNQLAKQAITKAEGGS